MPDRETRSSRVMFRRPLLLLGVLAGGALLGACEQDTLYDGELTGPNPTTVHPHTVSLAVTAADRMEMTDSIRVVVAARDKEGGEGIARVGVTARIINTARPDTLVLTHSVDLEAPTTGTVVREFAFAPPHVDGLALPDTLSLEMYGFAVNAAGSCVAAVEEEDQRLACEKAGDGFVAVDAAGSPAEVVVTAGRTYLLPTEGRISDALVGVSGSRAHLYLSNLTAHRVDVLDLHTDEWAEVKVGSQPWGLALDLSGDTLMVANSGGTNISFIPTATLSENLSRRVETPNTVLWEVTTVLDTLDQPHYTVEYHDFSDRPQFIAQDSTGRILYSTVPTEAGPLGTIRYTVWKQEEGWQRPEVRILFTGEAINDNPSVWAVAHVDSMRAFRREGASDLIEVYDHVPGFPGDFISSGKLPSLQMAVDSIRQLGSDAFIASGSWDLEAVGFSDTTFVAASENRGKVAFGEGAVAPAGRILIWDAAREDVSNEISVTDLVNNASERVLGIGLNEDGSFGVARGEQATYFFDGGLRLKGTYDKEMTGGGGGAALQRPSRSSSDPILAYVGTSKRSIQVIETSHYLPLGEIQIRDQITGPLRVSRPLPGDNQGLACPGDPRCVVAKLYGVTDAGGVVLVDVREKDLSNE